MATEISDMGLWGIARSLQAAWGDVSAAGLPNLHLLPFKRPQDSVKHVKQWWLSPQAGDTAFRHGKLFVSERDEVSAIDCYAVGFDVEKGFETSDAMFDVPSEQLLADDWCWHDVVRDLDGDFAGALRRVLEDIERQALRITLSAHYLEHPKNADWVFLNFDGTRLCKARDEFGDSTSRLPIAFLHDVQEVETLGELREAIDCLNPGQKRRCWINLYVIADIPIARCDDRAMTDSAEAFRHLKCWLK